MAVGVHTVVCLEHIDHTRLQIDNAPCPKLKREVASSDSTRCCCRDNGYRCIRVIPGIKADNGHSWSFVKEGSTGAKTESIEESVKSFLKFSKRVTG